MAGIWKHSKSGYYYITYYVNPPYSSLKLRVLPVEWFYTEHGWHATHGDIVDAHKGV